MQVYQMSSDLEKQGKNFLSPDLFFDSENPLNKEQDQLKRQKSALKLNVKSIEHVNKTGVINDYDVSLTFCSCGDFIRRRKPCKHMYRLAHELGIFHLNGNVVNDSSMKNDTEKKELSKKLLKIVEELGEDGKFVLYNVMYAYMYQGKIPLTIKNTATLKELVNNELVSYTDFNIDSLSAFFKKSELTAIVKENQCAIKLTKKTSILESLKNDYPEIFNKITADLVSVVPSDGVLLSPRKIYSCVKPDDPDDEL